VFTASAGPEAEWVQLARPVSALEVFCKGLKDFAANGSM
jgi:hypothetical protein